MANHRFIFGLALVALTCGISAANATTVTYSLDDYVGTGTPPSGPYGTVTLNDNGGSNVTVTVALASGEGFVKTGAGGALEFDLSGVSNIAITGLTAGFSLDSTHSGSNHTGGAGNFDYEISCGTACGSGGSSPYTGTLSFTIDNVTLAELADADGSGFYFASDICTAVSGGNCNNGITGNIASDMISPTPLPAAVSLFAGGLGMFGLLGARRRRKVKSI